MKQRQKRNRIDSSYTDHGILLKGPALISAEVLGFVNSLLGTVAVSLPAVDHSNLICE